MYRIHQIKLRPGEARELLPQKILKKLGRSDLIIKEWKIARESIDARDKNNIYLVYSVDFVCVYKKNPARRARLASEGKVKLEITPDTSYKFPKPGSGALPLKKRPVIVGFGPGGMFAALILAQAGYRPIVLERGQRMEERTETVKRFWEEGKLDTQSNVQFGEGGAGTFSDGKLTTGTKDIRIAKVLEELVKAGAPEDILYKQKPHIGTDILREVVKNIREEIIALGGEVRFDSQVCGVLLEETGAGKKVKGLAIRKIDRSGKCPEEEEILECEAAVFAIGHSARDTFRMLHDAGIYMEQKPFSIGVRIEHPQELIDGAQYGKPSGKLGLPPADYKINHRCDDGRGVYTFCMCPGGEVIVASSQEGGVVTNGMSYRGRASGTANSALLCDVRTSDFGSEEVLAGVEFQEKYERLAFANGGGGYKPPKSTWGQLRNGEAPAVENSLPAFAVSAFREAMPYLGKKIKGFDDDNAVVTAVETRSSSPVRIVRDENMHAQTGRNKRNEQDERKEQNDRNGRTDRNDRTAPIEGFYPCGEGAGYAGGITSAAVDGIRVAEAIIKGKKPNIRHRGLQAPARYDTINCY